MYKVIFKMLRLIAFIALSLFATYMESSVLRGKAFRVKVIPRSNQLPA